jgi:vacuolar-type H+-ATPase subunit D/Vma8
MIPNKGNTFKKIKQYLDEQYFELYTFYQNIQVGGGEGVSGEA